MEDQPTSNPVGSPKVIDTTPGAASSTKEFDRFEQLAGKLVNVPKDEVDEQRRGES